MNAGACMHLETLYGDNSHHIAESGFKALARALRHAIEPDPQDPGPGGLDQKASYRPAMSKVRLDRLRVRVTSDPPKKAIAEGRLCRGPGRRPWVASSDPDVVAHRRTAWCCRASARFAHCMALVEAIPGLTEAMTEERDRQGPTVPGRLRWHAAPGHPRPWSSARRRAWAGSLATSS